MGFPLLQNDILPALKGGVSPPKEEGIFASIHPRDESRGFLEAQNNFYGGKLKNKEREELQVCFWQPFTKKTENYYIIPLCKTWYDNAGLSTLQRQKIEYPSYKIIE